MHVNSKSTKYSILIQGSFKVKYKVYMIFKNIVHSELN